MLFLIFLLQFFCRKGEFIMKPASSKYEIFRIYGNLSLRVENEPPGMDNLPFIIVQISNLGDGTRSMKIAKNYICAPEEGNILTISSQFDHRLCSWVFETNSDATVSLKNRNLYLVKTDEMDNRLRSHGFKMRLLPTTALHDYKWEIKSASIFKTLKPDDEDSKPNNLNDLPLDEANARLIKPKKTESLVVGVSTKLKMPVKQQ
ncbi:hypothetical protein M153_30400001143 [Pseudoloma neurophilia]|uniref:Uncharacterized protein n=1 Tax=Pseudoloma neurophilia TaxID=146866 RepID=A0A0R0LTH7_9MICR|nr:hypothetical protein M153_30400001143 [Pseudoloma neurophilia]